MKYDVENQIESPGGLRYNTPQEVTSKDTDGDKFLSRSPEGGGEKIDSLLFGKYRVLRILGQGGSGKVYLVRHETLDALRAVKVISKDHIYQSQFLSEVRFLRDLRHPSIPVIYDIEEDEKNVYIVEEYMEGETLSAFRQRQGTLSQDQVVEILLSLSEVLCYLHERENPVLYLDLKPDNVLICNGMLRLVDFGSACLQKGETRHYSTGTSGYYAPEQALYPVHDVRSDIFGFGSLIPFLAGRAMSPGLERIWEGCCQREPERRFSSMRQVQHALAALRPKEGDFLSIAIAGTGRGLGVTHFAISMAVCLNRRGLKTLYREEDMGTVFASIKCRYEVTNELTGLYRFRGCYFAQAGFAQRSAASKGKAEFSCEILDLGVLTREKKEQFVNADCPVLLPGLREWQRRETEEVLRLLWDAEQVCFAIPCGEKKNFLTVDTHFSTGQKIEIPVQTDPFERYSERDEALLCSFAEGRVPKKQPFWVRKANRKGDQ